MLACHETNLRLKNMKNHLFTKSLQHLSLNSTPTLPKALCSTFCQHRALGLLVNEKHICNFVKGFSVSRCICAIVSYGFKELRECVFGYKSNFQMPGLFGRLQETTCKTEPPCSKHLTRHCGSVHCSNFGIQPIFSIRK